jgi:DNA-binding HxlR family transcriptional regulator
LLGASYNRGVRHKNLAELPCPIARTLELVGEWWTLLIVRDGLLGARRFEDFKRTGIADNVLSARLKRLVDQGIMERRRYQVRPERYEYVLTPRGRSLGPVIAALRAWGQEWTTGEDRSPRLVHRRCGHEVSVGLRCERCDQPLEAADVEPRPQAGSADADRRRSAGVGEPAEDRPPGAGPAW